VVEPGRREPGHILAAHVEALGPELFQRRVHADRVPRHDDTHHQAQGAELVFLALAAAPAMRLVVNEAEQVEDGSLHSGASATAEIGG